MARRFATRIGTIRANAFAEKPCLHLGEAKPGGSKPRGFQLFSGKVLIGSRTVLGLFLVGAVNRPRKRKRANRENPRRVPGQIGKIRKIRKGPNQKDKKGRTSPDRETPPFETPPPPFSGPWLITFERFARIASNLRFAIFNAPERGSQESGSAREPSGDSRKSPSRFARIGP